jgi:hypothetical protein
VTAGTIYTGAGIVTVAAAPVVATVAETADEAIIVGFADNPRVWQGTMDVAQGLFQPTSRPTTPEGLVMRIIMGYWIGKH